MEYLIIIILLILIYILYRLETFIRNYYSYNDTLNSEIDIIKVRFDNEFKSLNNFLDFYDILDIKTIIDDRNYNLNLYKIYSSEINNVLEEGKLVLLKEKLDFFIELSYTLEQHNIYIKKIKSLYINFKKIDKNIDKLFLDIERIKKPEPIEFLSINPDSTFKEYYEKEYNIYKEKYGI